jgi:hypothetical protein
VRRSWLNALTFLTLLVSLSLAGCTQGEGGLCEVASDCGEGLTCCPPSPLPEGRGICVPTGECAPTMPDAGPRPDAGRRDAGTPVDAGTDAGARDAGSADAGAPDAGTPDAGSGDSGAAMDAGPAPTP